MATLSAFDRSSGQKVWSYGLGDIIGTGTIDYLGGSFILKLGLTQLTLIHIGSIPSEVATIISLPNNENLQITGIGIAIDHSRKGTSFNKGLDGTQCLISTITNASGAITYAVYNVDYSTGTIGSTVYSTLSILHGMGFNGVQYLLGITGTESQTIKVMDPDPNTKTIKIVKSFTSTRTYLDYAYDGVSWWTIDAISIQNHDVNLWNSSLKSFNHGLVSASGITFVDKYLITLSI